MDDFLGLLVQWLLEAALDSDRPALQWAALGLILIVAAWLVWLG